jgi:hypothetical protein
MNQHIAESILATLDRKYEFVVSSPIETFMLDLKGFMGFINEDELVSDFTSKLVNGANARGRLYKEQLEKEKALAAELKEVMVKTYPVIDDSNRTQQGIADIMWEYSFAASIKLLPSLIGLASPLSTTSWTTTPTSLF